MVLHCGELFTFSVDIVHSRQRLPATSMRAEESCHARGYVYAVQNWTMVDQEMEERALSELSTRRSPTARDRDCDMPSRRMFSVARRGLSGLARLPWSVVC